MYESDNVDVENMGYFMNAGHVIWHDFLYVARQLVDVRKAGKMVIGVKLCKTRPIKCISKLFAYFIMKKEKKMD